MDDKAAGAGLFWRALTVLLALVLATGIPLLILAVNLSGGDETVVGATIVVAAWVIAFLMLRYALGKVTGATVAILVFFGAFLFLGGWGCMSYARSFSSKSEGSVLFVGGIICSAIGGALLAAIFAWYRVRGGVAR